VAFAKQMTRRCQGWFVEYRCRSVWKLDTSQSRLRRASSPIVGEPRALPRHRVVGRPSAACADNCVPYPPPLIDPTPVPAVGAALVAARGKLRHEPASVHRVGAAAPSRPPVPAVCPVIFPEKSFRFCGFLLYFSGRLWYSSQAGVVCAHDPISQFRETAWFSHGHSANLILRVRV